MCVARFFFSLFLSLALLKCYLYLLLFGLLAAPASVCHTFNSSSSSPPLLCRRSLLLLLLLLQNPPPTNIHIVDVVRVGHDLFVDIVYVIFAFSSLISCHKHSDDISLDWLTEHTGCFIFCCSCSSDCSPVCNPDAFAHTTTCDSLDICCSFFLLLFTFQRNR